MCQSHTHTVPAFASPPPTLISQQQIVRSDTSFDCQQTLSENVREWDIFLEGLWEKQGLFFLIDSEN